MRRREAAKRKAGDNEAGDLLTGDSQEVVVVERANEWVGVGGLDGNGDGRREGSVGVIEVGKGR